jgi:hypothetical protein
MKIVDSSQFDMTKEGIEFRIPCSSVKKEDPEEELLPRIERNEDAVYWLQPKGGTVDQQEACTCVNGKFYTLNCKFEKAIFRSVRLTRDFQNYDVPPRQDFPTALVYCFVVVPKRVELASPHWQKRVLLSLPTLLPPPWPHSRL